VARRKCVSEKACTYKNRVWSGLLAVEYVVISLLFDSYDVIFLVI